MPLTDTHIRSLKPDVKPRKYFDGGGLASRGMLEELKRCIAEIRELRQEIVQLGGVYRGNSKTHRK